MIGNLRLEVTNAPDYVIADLAVTDLAVTEAGSNWLTAGWTATGDDGMTGTASRYVVKYSTMPITEANFDAAMTAPKLITSFTLDSFYVVLTIFFAVSGDMPRRSMIEW